MYKLFNSDGAPKGCKIMGLAAPIAKLTTVFDWLSNMSLPNGSPLMLKPLKRRKEFYRRSFMHKNAQNITDNFCQWR
jgi:hypothetical protein